MAKVSQGVQRVLRSIFLFEDQDRELRRLSYEYNVSKSQIVRSALRKQFDDWKAVNDKERLVNLLTLSD